MGKGAHCEGLTFHSKELEIISPGFYVDADGTQYFCLSEFLLVHQLPLTMDFIHVVLEDVIQEFPGITVFEFAG
jgi:hypothetical protein